jgi:RNA polymerase-binding transcription factor DksA
MKSLKDRRLALTTRMDYLEAKLHEIDDELETHNSPDWEELAVERETDEVLEGMGISGLEEMRAITAALERMDTGEYGNCVSCGERISEERLDVLPYTPFCKSCAAEKSATH